MERHCLSTQLGTTAVRGLLTPMALVATSHFGNFSRRCLWFASHTVHWFALHPNQPHCVNLVVLDGQTDDALRPIFSNFAGGNDILRQNWTSPGAYPKSTPLPHFPPPGAASHSFVLDEHGRGGLYYPSALEGATSAMEVMAVRCVFSAAVTRVYS